MCTYTCWSVSNLPKWFLASIILSDNFMVVSMHGYIVKLS